MPPSTKRLPKAINPSYFYVALITLFGAGLRLFRLGQWSLWVDEVFTIYAAQNFWRNLSEWPFFALTEFPTTSIVMGFFLRNGVNEWNARLGPALIGVVTIPLVFLAVRKMFDQRVALLTAVFLSVAPWHIHWSQNARFYILMLLFFTLALFFFYFGLEENKIGYILFSLHLFGLAATERLLAGYFLPIIFIYTFLVWVLPNQKPSGLNFKNVGLLFGLAFIIILFSGWTFISEPGLWQDIYFIDNRVSPLNIILQHVRGIDVHILMVGFVGGAVLLFQQQYFRPVLFLLISALTPLLLTTGVSVFQFAHGRYTFLSLIFWLVLAALAVFKLVEGNKQRSQAVMLGSIVIALFIFVPLQELYDYYTVENGGRIEWKSTFFYLDEQIQPDDILISNDPIVGEFYISETFVDMHTVDSRFIESAICDLENRAWVVMGGKSRIHSQFERIIQEVGTAIEFNAHNIRLFVVEPATLNANLSCQT
ncbi:MAG: glycosyltransferase family 39 protein [Chloroflexota bacterium]